MQRNVDAENFCLQFFRICIKVNSYRCGALLNGSYLSNDFFKTGSEVFFLLVYSVNNLHLWPSLLQQLFLDILEKNNLTLI